MHPPRLLIFLLCTLGSAPIGAQPTNVEILGRLAVGCLDDVPSSVETFSLVSGPRMPYLRPFLTRNWLDRGLVVFVGDSTVPDRRVHSLEYRPESASVSYARARKDSLVRTVDLALSHSFLSPEGRLLSESRCREAATDMIRAGDVSRLQQDPWEETRGVVPPQRSWRTWAEPAVIGTSIAVVVYLFFSVRS